MNELLCDKGPCPIFCPKQWNRYLNRVRRKNDKRGRYFALICCCLLLINLPIKRKHQNSASLAFVKWIHRSPVNSPHKVPVTRKMFPVDATWFEVIFYKAALLQRPISKPISTQPSFLKVHVFREDCRQRITGRRRVVQWANLGAHYEQSHENITLRFHDHLSLRGFRFED